MQIKKKKIAVFYTGGTISMKTGSDGGVNLQEKNPLADRDSDFLAGENIELAGEQVFGGPVPSPHISEQHMVKLRNAIAQRVGREQLDGVVVTHGTDTLEETAYFLDLTLDLPIPVVVTGSCRSADALGSDAVYNYRCAIQTAASEAARGMGVLVVFNDEIHPARAVTKTHTTNLATFQSPGLGPVGQITADGVRFDRSLPPRAHWEVERMTKKVMLLKAFAGIDPLFFEALDALEEKRAGEGGGGRYPIDGLVVEALGAGNLPAAIAGCLQKLEAKGVPVVLASRCISGRVEALYAYPGGLKDMKENTVKHLILSDGISGVKARVKLAVLLEKNLRQDELEAAFVR